MLTQDQRKALLSRPVCKVHIISLIDIIDNHNTSWMCDKCGAHIWQTRSIVTKYSSFQEQRRQGYRYHMLRNGRQAEVFKWTDYGMARWTKTGMKVHVWVDGKGKKHEGSDTSIILHTPDEMYDQDLEVTPKAKDAVAF